VLEVAPPVPAALDEADEADEVDEVERDPPVPPVLEAAPPVPPTPPAPPEPDVIIAPVEDECPALLLLSPELAAAPDGVSPPPQPIARAVTRPEKPSKIAVFRANPSRFRSTTTPPDPAGPGRR